MVATTTATTTTTAMTPPLPSPVMHASSSPQPPPPPTPGVGVLIGGGDATSKSPNTLHQAIRVPPGFPDLHKPQYPQDVYWGRVRHFMDVTDPRTLWATDAALQRAKQLMDDYDRGVIYPEVSIDTYRQAKKLCAATFHPDTGEKVLLPFRMASFVPTNMLIIAGMLIPNPSNMAILFWQWLNQSVNVGFNYFNANKSAPMSTTETAAAYGAAVTASCGVALGLSRLAKGGKLPRSLAPLIPFTAVAVAGTANVFLMRQKELRDGITVTDEEGHPLGKSRIAGLQAVTQVSVSRVATAFPCLFVPSLVLSRLERWTLFRRHPALLVPANLGLVAGSLMTALPCAVGLFPQRVKVPVSSLEPELQGQRTTSGDPITDAYFNRGL